MLQLVLLALFGICASQGHLLPNYAILNYGSSYAAHVVNHAVAAPAVFAQYAPVVHVPVPVPVPVNPPSVAVPVTTVAKPVVGPIAPATPVVSQPHVPQVFAATPHAKFITHLTPTTYAAFHSLFPTTSLLNTVSYTPVSSQPVSPVASATPAVSPVARTSPENLGPTPSSPTTPSDTVEVGLPSENPENNPLQPNLQPNPGSLIPTFARRPQPNPRAEIPQPQPENPRSINPALPLGRRIPTRPTTPQDNVNNPQGNPATPLYTEANPEGGALPQVPGPQPQPQQPVPRFLSNSPNPDIEEARVRFLGNGGPRGNYPPPEERPINQPVPANPYPIYRPPRGQNQPNLFAPQFNQFRAPPQQNQFNYQQNQYRPPQNQYIRS